MDPLLWLVFAFLFAAAGNFFGLRVEHLACGAGYPRRWLKSLPYFLGLLRFYKGAAPEKGWPVWYIPAFWICCVLMFVSGIFWFILDSRAAPEKRFTEELFWELFPWFLLLSLITNLILSFRLVRRLRLVPRGQPLFPNILQDAELRGSLLTVVSGWLGLVLASCFYWLMRDTG